MKHGSLQGPLEASDVETVAHLLSGIGPVACRLMQQSRTAQSQFIYDVVDEMKGIDQDARRTVRRLETPPRMNSSTLAALIHALTTGLRLGFPSVNIHSGKIVLKKLSQ